MAAEPEQLALFGEVEAAPAPLAPVSGGRQAPSSWEPPPVPSRIPKVPSPVPGPRSPGGLVQPLQATHQTMLNGQPLGYVLRRSARKSIGFAISVSGLTVTAPRWVTLHMVETALQSKASWVLRKLQHFQEQQATPVRQVQWGDGAELAWLGGTVVVRLGTPDSASTKSAKALRVHLDVDTQTVWVGLPQLASPAQVRDAVQAWMQQQALAHFQERLAYFAPQLGVRWTQLRLSSAATRWGSAKADGSIRLHWRLMQFPSEVLDYVVVHELAHLKHMDHSPRFWATVGQIVPDYALLRARLRGERLPAW